MVDPKLAPKIAEADGAAAAERTVPVLRLKRGEERRLAAGHLWVFSNEVDTDRTPLGAFSPGELAQLRSSRDVLLGTVYVNPHALICARVLSRDAAQPVDESFIERRLTAALALRERLGDAAYGRWVFGESDLLPGLVLDRYGDLVVGQIATAGMEALKQQVESAIARVVSPRALFWKNDSAARELERLPQVAAGAFGEIPPEVEIIESGLSFSAPLAGGQKTGWFYDQSANRARLRRYVAPGARVLDACSYAGAWAVTALDQGAGRACCLDSSQLALEFARRNAARNAARNASRKAARNAARSPPGNAGHEAAGDGTALEVLHADVFEGLKTLAAQGAQFDLVILDPPAFIKRKKDIPKGQAAYRKLNQLALGVLAEEGLLVSCSCSYHLGADELLGAIQSAARHAGRFLQVLEAGGQSPDHPVHPAIPETRYLKAFFCRVTRALG